MACLPEPVTVNGTIKLFRYLALGFGVLWGQHRQVKLKKREAEIHKIQVEQNEIRNAKRKIVKQFENREEMLYLGDQAGVIGKDNFDEQYPPPSVKKLEILCDREVSFVTRNKDREGVRPPLTSPCTRIDDIKEQYPVTPEQDI